MLYTVRLDPFRPAGLLNRCVQLKYRVRRSSVISIGDPRVFLFDPAAVFDVFLFFMGLVFRLG